MGMRRVCSTALSRSTSAGGRAEYPGPVRRHHTSRRSHVCLRAAGNTAPTGDSDPVLAAKRTRLEALLSQEGTELSTSSSGRGVQVGFSTPPVDWSRYHLQLLFVDRTDTLRSRIAAGLCDRIAEWNGFGRALYAWTCGLEVPPRPEEDSSTTSVTGPWSHQGDTHGDAAGNPLGASPFTPLSANSHSTTHVGGSGSSGGTGAASKGSRTAEPSSSTEIATSTGHTGHMGDIVCEGEDEAEAAHTQRVATVLSHAAELKIPLRSVARAAERFEIDDLDRYDLVLCMDRSIRDTILAEVQPEHRAYYEEKVCLLTSFAAYESDNTMLARGGSALLPSQLSVLLTRPGSAGVQGPVGGPPVAPLAAARGAVDIVSPRLDSAGAGAEWDSMVKALIVSNAGLVKYLMDAMPENHWAEP